MGSHAPRASAASSAVRDGVCVITVTGEVDVASADSVTALVAECAGPTVVDLRACGFFGAEGLRVLLEGRRLGVERGARFVVLVAGTGPIARLLNVIDGKAIFNVCVDDLGAAIKLAAQIDRRQGVDRRA